MSKTVFLLGAGASKLAGAPLMGDFLDVAHDLWQLQRVSKSADSFEKVFSAIAALQQVHSKARLDTTNIEVVFSALEVANTLGKFPGKSPEDIPGLLDALKAVIVATLETTITFTVPKDGPIHAPRPYDEFVKLLRHLRDEATPTHSVAILTFNYDICADVALYVNGLKPNYALTAESDKGSIPLLKLHGSLNWAERSSEPKIKPWPFEEYWRGRQLPYQNNYNFLNIPIGSQLDELRRNDPDITGKPVIVAPTSNKGESHRNLSAVWSRAAAELAEAENIFVIGYSMPPTDSFFHYLYALGTVGPTPLKRFWVFNPDNSDAIESRFRELLGPGAEARYQYHARTFEQAIGDILGSFPKKK